MFSASASTSSLRHIISKKNTVGLLLPDLPKRFSYASTPTFQLVHKKLIAALPDDHPVVEPLPQGLAVPLSKHASFGEREVRLILIDGKAVVYRAYYKLMAKMQHGGLSDMSGESDWVLTVFTALSTVLKLFELKPSHIAVVFDHQGLTFRHTLFSNYKLNRSPTPDTVTQSLRYVKPALTAMGMKTIEVPGVEADDVIGTLAVSAAKAGSKGVPGIGEKTAVKLIKLYGSLEKLLEERNEVRGKRALHGLLEDNGDVLLGKRLVMLRTDLPHYMVPFTLEDLLYKKPQDGGDRYFNLLKAMGSFVDTPFLEDHENRTRGIWLKY